MSRIILISYPVIFAVCHMGMSTAKAQETLPRTYSDYYAQQLHAYHQPSIDLGRYTFDKYFYHNPAVSPYLNLLRPSGSYVNNYFQYVLPEEQRRQQVMTRMDEPLRTGGRSIGIGGGTLPGPYYNHWYGGRQALGLSP